MYANEGHQILSTTGPFCCVDWLDGGSKRVYPNKVINARFGKWPKSLPRGSEQVSWTSLSTWPDLFSAADKTAVHA